LRIYLQEKVEELNEVVVEKKLSNRKRYKLEKYLVRTSYGYTDFEKWSNSGFVKFFKGEDLNQNAFTFVDAIRSKIPMNVSYDISEKPIVTFKKPWGGNVPILYDIDGNLTGEAPTNLLMDQIEKLVILSGTYARGKYGEIGAAGVIVINTRLANFVFEPGSEAAYDFAKQRHKIYKKLQDSNANFQDLSNFRKALSGVEFFHEAEKIFKEYQQIEASNPYFKLEAANYFKTYFPQLSFGDQLYNKIIKEYSSEPEILKALSYIFETQQAYQKALRIQRMLLKLTPNNLQVYRDIANLNRLLKEDEKAIQFYALYHQLKENFKNSDQIDYDTSNIDEVVKTEALLLHHKNNYLKEEKLQNYAATKIDEIATRVVVEWNNPLAEFEMEVINPNKHYFNWKHTELDNSTLLHSERTKGFGIKEFVMDDFVKGIWQFNITYKGNKTTWPSFLKVTTYFNYGREDEQIQTKYVELKAINKKLKILKFNNVVNTIM
jgi:hypothetical protein